VLRERSGKLRLGREVDEAVAQVIRGSGELPVPLAITAGMFLPAFAFSLLYCERLEALTEHARRLAPLLAVLLGGAAGLLLFR
jgi:hypothetical protein